MPTDSKILAINAAIFGLMTIFIFLSPFFLYSKNKDDFKREGTVKVVGDILFWHVLFMVGGVIVVTAIDAGIVRPEFMPSNGIKYFYGNGAGTMWDHWLAVDISTAFSSGPEGEILASAMVVFKYMSVFLYIICIIIPLAVLWTSVGYITSDTDQLRNNYNGYLSRLQGFFLVFFFMTALVLIHCSISSVLVQIAVPGFNFFTMINQVWSTLLFG